MTNYIDLDPTGGKMPLLPFGSSLPSVASVRVLPAQFARLMGCSKQAVSNWVKSGRVILGPDGRLEPSAAFKRLMETGDPTKLRAKVLRPMVEHLEQYRRRIVDLEAALGESHRTIAELRLEVEAAEEDNNFNESSAAGFSDIFDLLQSQIAEAWPVLVELPENGGAGIIIGWLDSALEGGVEKAGDLLSALDFAAEGDEGAAPAKCQQDRGTVHPENQLHGND